MTAVGSSKSPAKAGFCCRSAMAATVEVLGPDTYSETFAQGAELSLDDLVRERLSGLPSVDGVKP